MFWINKTLRSVYYTIFDPLYVHCVKSVTELYGVISGQFHAVYASLVRVKDTYSIIFKP